MRTIKEIVEDIVRKEHEIKTGELLERLEQLGYRKPARRTVRRYANNFRASFQGEIVPQVPKILLLDLETAPIQALIWSLWQKYIDKSAIEKDVSILSFTAKWLFSPSLVSVTVTPEEAHERHDGTIIGKLWELFDEADIIVAHNGNKFDLRVANARFILNQYAPPMPYRTVDTYKVCAKQFMFSSYKLDYLNKIFHLTRKAESSFQLWKDCVSGDPRRAVPAVCRP